MIYFYHIISRTEWDAVKDKKSYFAPTLATEGFMHMSTEAQLGKTAKRFFAGRQDIVALKIDPKKLKGEVKFEQARDVDDQFPHLFGPLNVDAVIEVIAVSL